MTVLNAIAHQKLIEDAEIFLQKLRRSILVWTRGGEGLEGLVRAPEQLGKLRESAVAAELDSIAELSGGLRIQLEMMIASGSPDPEADALPLLDKIAALEAEISNIRFGSDEFELDVENLLGDSFDKMTVNAEESGEEPEESEEDSWDDEEFEIDDEMLEIFAMEADDHLRNINENLERLESSPNDREALLEIRRSAHTLKGSAGIVGLARLSKLAHKVEDLLDHISENEIEGNAEIFNVLLSATDCISAVANNDQSRDIEEKITATFTRLDSMLGNIAEAGSAPEPKPLEAEVVEEVTAEVVEIEEEVKTAAFQQNQGNMNRSVVRISLDKLDELVTLVREMVFGRSVFQQRLSELEQQIKELQNSTRRLQRSTGKLETDFSAGSPGTSGGSGALGSFGAGALGGREGGEFDSLEMDKYTDFSQLTRELLETTTDAFSITTELNVIRSYFESLYDGQKRLIDEIQEKLLSLRMIKFESLSARLQRTVRMTASELDKLVDLHIEGESLEVDTHILDSLIEPLLHILRNAVAHGIERPETRRLLGKDEKGHITLKVYSEGTHIIVSISDDGHGISAEALKQKAVNSGLLKPEQADAMSDEDALKLVFLPGLTTADRISQISGRGVGMNIVKTNILRQQGTVSVASEFQRGTTFTIRVPMALAIARALLVKCNDRVFAFPLKLVKQISEISAESLKETQAAGTVVLGSGTFEVAYLNDLLSLPQNPATFASDSQLLLLDTIDRKCALVVDEIVKPEEVVIKPLGHPLKDMPELLGATILGDGSVVPVLDLVHIIDNGKIQEKTMKAPEPVRLPAPAPTPAPPVPVPANSNLTVMIVDDSPSVRLVNSRLVKSNGWEPVVAKDGSEALELLTSGAPLPDIVLTDVEMPEMDGYELLSMIKQHEKLRHLPVVMITSRAGDKHRLKAVELGVSEYLSKPYEDSKLVAIVKQLTGTV